MIDLLSLSYVIACDKHYTNNISFRRRKERKSSTKGDLGYDGQIYQLNNINKSYTTYPKLINALDIIKPNL